MRYIKLYMSFLVQNIKIMMEYRVDFIIGILSTFFMQLSGLLFVWVIFQNIENINGWSFYQVGFVYGLMTLAKSINHIFFDNLWVLGDQYIKTGMFDTLLLRPVSPLFHLIANKIQQDGIGNLIIGIIIVCVSTENLNLSFGFFEFILMIIFVISGGMIFAALNLITAVFSFWMVNSISLTFSVFSIHEFALYPLDIYNNFIKTLLTWIIPYAFASYYPAGFFLDKGIENLSYLSPVIAAVLWIIALGFWKQGIKNYSGTGS